MLSKEVSSTIFKVFGMMPTGIEPWSLPVEFRKNSTARPNGRKVNLPFQNPKNLRTLFSGHDVIPIPTSCLGFIMTDDDCHIIFAQA